MARYLDQTGLQDYTTQLTAKYKTVFATKGEVGTPLVASTAAAMTDTSKVYVYVGSESGYTSGNWYYYNGSAWVSGGVYNSTAFVTDDTLSVEGMAADAKATGDAVESLEDSVDEIFDDLQTKADFEMKSSDRYTIFINTSDKWSQSSSPHSYISKIPSGTEKIAITANETNFSVVSMLTTSSHTPNNTPDYATGIGREVVQAGTTKIFDVPSDAVYLYIYEERDGNTYMPSSIVTIKTKIIPAVDETLSISGDAADAKVAGEKFAAVFPVNLYANGNWTQGSVNSTTGASQTSSTMVRSDFINVEGIDNIVYTRLYVIASSVTHGMAFYTSDDASTFISGSGQGPVVNAEITHYELETVAVPDGAKYARFSWSPTYGQFAVYDLAQYSSAISVRDSHRPLGLHEAPYSEDGLNIVKRCRQMTDIKWTPAVDLDRYMRVYVGPDYPPTAEGETYLGVFKAGVEYTGIPYGRTNAMTAYGYSFATVGNYVGFDTFVSSVSNSNSKLCHEDVGTVAGHRSVIYASVCSGMTCYALGVPEVATENIPSISGLDEIGPLNSNGTLLDDNNIRIGYILNDAGVHTATITDIIRDSDGLIQFVELSDASANGLADKNYADGQIGGLCRRKGWTRNDLFYGFWKNYTVFRYAKSVSYTPSPYVAVGDEFNMQRVEHFPCMPYEGEGFVYKSGYIPNNAVKILISLGGYSHLMVQKDGVEISGSPFAVGADTKHIDISEISAGSYKANLCTISGGDVTAIAYPCTWTIITE